MTFMKRVMGSFMVIAAMAGSAAAANYDTDFNGTWRGYLRTIDPQIVSNALPDLTEQLDLMEIAIEISDGTPSVYIFQDGAWLNVKPGQFGLASHKTNAILASIDSSFSEDGEFGWVETWNITLTAKDNDNLYAYWVRSVSNPFLEDGTHDSARFFMSRFGTLERGDPIPGANAVQASTVMVSTSCTQSQIVCRTPTGMPNKSVKFNPKIDQN